MNQRMLWGLSGLAFLVLVLLGSVLSVVLDLVGADPGLLTVYLINKGLFAIGLLVVLAKWDGLRGYGFKRGRGWRFLLPGAPILVLTALVAVSPESKFGLGAAAALGWILVCIFVAIGEEGLFRGLFWRALEDRDMLTTSLLTSVFFGAAHLAGVFSPIPWQIIVSQAVFAAGVGMMFAAVRLFSGSLLAPIFLHAVFDAGAVVASGGVQEMFADTVTVGRLLVPGIAFFVWGLIWILVIRRRPRRVVQVPGRAAALEA
ncbi:MAG: lysostaphin resistance A-like protein [Planctomycetota bacterium]|jgi:membrane protease YdiL (CAAX protease family)